jgi:hypothetical protein
MAASSSVDTTEVEKAPSFDMGTPRMNDLGRIVRARCRLQQRRFTASVVGGMASEASG